MAYKLPGNKNVTVYSSWQEAQAAGAIDKVELGSDGNLYATPHQGWLLRNMPWLVMGGMAVGAGLAAAGIGAGASAAPAAAGGVLPSSSYPVASLMGGPAAITSMGVSSGVGAGVGTAAGVAAGVGGAAAKGVGGKILDWLKNPQNLLGLAAAVPLAANAFGGGSSTSSPHEDALLAEIRTNLGLQRKRFEGAQPAFDAAQRMAVGMAPTRYTGGA